MTEYGLGRKVQFDERSRAFQALMAPTLATKLHRPPPLSKRLDQGSLGACTGYSTVQALNTAGHRKPRSRWYNNQHAIAVYSDATLIDPWDGAWPPDDTGSSVLCAAKVAKDFSYIRAYRWAFGLDQALAALMLQPIIVGTDWHDGMFEPNRHGFIEPTGEVVGGHAYCLHGLNVRDKYVHVLNSWGTGWGLGGRAKMTFADLGRLLERDGEAVVLTV